MTASARYDAPEPQHSGVHRRGQPHTVQRSAVADISDHRPVHHVPARVAAGGDRRGIRASADIDCDARRPEQTDRERSLLERWARIYSRFNEVLSGIITVRSFAMEDTEKARFLQEVSCANRAVIKGVATDVRYGAASNVTIAGARLLAVGLGGYLVLNGEITIGTVIAFLGYVGALYTPLQGLSGVYSAVRKATVSMDEIFGILNAQDHLGDSPHAISVARVRGDVKFENVHFGYEEDGRKLLNSVSLHAAAGQTVALVGPSGSGKTTMMTLLMRFYDPQEGSITIDGVDLRKIKQSSLRRNIGVVLQDPLLFNDSIAANIAYGRPGASASDIEKAARAAQAHEFISKLPDGYNSPAGERGGLLSVGERQRITIARALLKNPPILILDEATSALDADAEAAVQTAVDSLMNGRTTFVIAHRLATVIDADAIIALKDGRIIEQGTHTHLLRSGGYYASLVERQSRGLIANHAGPAARVLAAEYGGGAMITRSATHPVHQ